MKKQFALLWAALALTACDGVGKAAPISKEDQCLNSFRLELNDPDSGVVVANLGDRGLTLDHGEFFLRYKAKNGYGAYMSSNVLCAELSGGYQRFSLGEINNKLKVSNACLAKNIQFLRASKKPPIEDCQRFAEREFYEGVGNLRAIESLNPDSY